MMDEKDYTNEFRFSLTQGDVILAERIFSADNYSPLTRSFIDIRGILPNIIHRLQYLLSSKKINTILDNNLDGYGYYMNIVNSFPKELRDSFLYKPKIRWSPLITDEVGGIVYLIKSFIRDKDIDNIWDDYDLINNRGLSINQIRDLSPQTRRRYLREIK
jgi:hypothetical protein